MSVNIVYTLILVTFALITTSLVLTIIPKRHKNKADPDQPGAKFVAEEGQSRANQAQVGQIIPPGNGDLVEGAITLTISQGAKSRLISYLILSLSEDPNIQLVSKGGIAAKDCLIRLFIKKPIPLFKVLYHIPVVQEVTRQGYDIHVVMI